MFHRTKFVKRLCVCKTDFISIIGKAMVASAATLAACPGYATDLLDVYAQARTSDPVVQQAAAIRESVHEGVGIARGPLLPQLSAGMTLNEVQPDPNNLSNPHSRSRDPAVTLTQTLFDWSKFSALKVSQAQATSQDETYRSEVQALPVRVATAYFNILLATEMLNYAQANEDAFAEQVRNAEVRYKSGLSAQVDLVQTRAYYASAKSNTINMRTALVAAREALSQITGVPTGDLKALREDVPPASPEPANPETWGSMALQHNPSIQSLQDSLAAAEYAIDGARAGHLPTLNASVGVGRPTNWPLDGSGMDGRRSTTIGITLNVPLYSGGSIQSQVRQNIALRDAARQALELRRRQVVGDVKNEYQSIQADIQLIAEGRQAVEAAQSALASTRVGQRNGTQSMTDLLLAIQLLTAQQIAFSQARHKLVTDTLLLKQDAGVINENDLVAVNAQLQ